jgi:ornithine racemase
MASLRIDTGRILANIKKLNNYLSTRGITWSLVTKVLSGHKPTLEKLLESETVLDLHSIGDSRMSNLRAIKSIRPDIVTMYLKPVASAQVKNIVKYADISLNTSLKTIKALDAESAKQGLQHRVVIMVELGELREGIAGDNVLQFYEDIFRLENIKVIGLGSNLGCMHGVEPSYDKLVQLSLYKQIIDEKFGKKLELVSGGSSITLPLLTEKKVPRGVNHFRIGESAFLGNNLLSGKQFRNLSTSAFDFSAEIVELEKKHGTPDGNISDGNVGYTAEIENQELSYRGILDFGLLDVEVQGLHPVNADVRYVGTTSDMTVYDIGKFKKTMTVGTKVHFKPSYMAVARLMHSRYISKKVI